MNEALFISKLKLTCQLSIIDNRSVSEEILKELMSISNSSKVKSRIGIVLGELENVAVSELTFNQCLRLVKRSNCPSGILEEAYKQWEGKHGEDYELMRIIGGHLNTPTYILSQIIVSYNWSNREITARNPNTPSADLEKCLEVDDDLDVLTAAAKNPSTPIEAIIALSKSEDPDRRWAAACSPRLPARFLDGLVDDESEDIFHQVLDNPNLAMESMVWALYSGRHLSRIPDHLLSQTRKRLERIEAEPGMRSQVESLKAAAELGIRPSIELINLNEINI
jgi:hypothetical protein